MHDWKTYVAENVGVDGKMMDQLARLKNEGSAK